MDRIWHQHERELPEKQHRLETWLLTNNYNSAIALFYGLTSAAREKAALALAGTIDIDPIGQTSEDRIYRQIRDVHLSTIAA